MLFAFRKGYPRGYYSESDRRLETGSQADVQVGQDKNLASENGGGDAENPGRDIL